MVGNGGEYERDRIEQWEKLGHLAASGVSCLRVTYPILFGSSRGSADGPPRYGREGPEMCGATKP